jgi:adenine-specific DNA-methyltransferase
MENSRYLSDQIITYIGNKRALLEQIDKKVILVKTLLNKDKISTCDLFSGSGIVSRLLKQHSSFLIANDLEAYSEIINRCHLCNASDFSQTAFDHYLELLNKAVAERPINGIITDHYAPANSDEVKENERCFYTHENAILIDSYRHYIDEMLPEDMKVFFLARLLTEASIHTNTSGVFKGFYKNRKGIGQFGGEAQNALSRIKGRITIDRPILSNYECEHVVYREDANSLIRRLGPLDLVYIDTPYDQHPYGSNYFMLNLILKNQMPDNISRVSGIPSDWNRSSYNKANEALQSMEDLIANIRSHYVLISYNNEGFIHKQEMELMLKKYGDLVTDAVKYNAFRGSRNLSERNIYTDEYFFLLEKKD